jgi:hypothetical protein
VLAPAAPDDQDLHTHGRSLLFKGI